MGRRRNERIEDETRGGISKTHRGKIQKQFEQLKDGTLDLSACLKNSTVTVEEVQDPRPPSLPMICDVMVALKDAEYDKDTDSMLDDTDVDEPPPCPVEMMNQN